MADRRNETLKSPHVTVVVLNFNGGEDVLRCLESIRESDIEGGRVLTVVVDNDSRDDSLVRVEGEFPEAQILRNSTNLGYCEGNNVGIRFALESGSSFVLLINDDATLLPGALQEMVEPLERDPSIGIVGPKILLDPERDRVWSAGGGFFFRANVLSLIGHGEADQGQFDESREVAFVPGCALLVRSEVFQEVGLLDPHYFAYFEDADLCYRAREKGVRIWYEASARVLHKVSASTGGGISPARKYLMGLNSVRFLRRHGTLWMWLSFFLLDLLAFPAVYLAGVFSGRRRAMGAKGRGLWDGLRGVTASGAALERFAAPRPAPTRGERGTR